VLGVRTGIERVCHQRNSINLFLKDKKGTLFLVTALEDAVIELKSLHRLLGAGGRLSFGSADLMRERWGSSPGRSRRLPR
jgi:Ala-tRNA(Pro) deacylase